MFFFSDKTLPSAEIRATVKTLRNRRTGGSAMIRVKNIKGWLRRAETEEETQKE